MREGEVFLVLVLTLFAPHILLAASLVFTVVHAAEEVWGEGGPLWRYFGRLSGVHVPDWLGLLGVGLFVPCLSAAAAWLAYETPETDSLAPAFCGFLAGLRTGDFVSSHAAPRVAFAGPNPGFASSFLYLAEGCFVFAVYPVAAAAVVCGFLVFVAGGLPALGLAGFLVRQWRGT
jgi:hypothetical protein